MARPEAHRCWTGRRRLKFINLSQDRRGARREIDEIKKATDGRLDLEVPELPELQVMAKRTVDIPEVVRDAAAKLTGLPESDFTIDVGY